MKRIAIITEFLHNFGGIEKTILTVAKELSKGGIKVDIYAGLYDKNKTFEEFKNLNVKTFLRKKLPPMINTLYLRWKFKFLKLNNYDGFIFYGFHSLSASKNNHPNIWWSINPLGYIYGKNGKGAEEEDISYLYKESIIKKTFIFVYLKFLRYLDQKNIKGVDKIFCVGHLAKGRLNKAYPNKEIEILYAPIDTNKLKYLSKGKYYLSVARLVPERNVDKIVEAFQKMPRKKLLIVGDGPLKDKISLMSKDYPNITLMGFLKEDKLREVIGKSIGIIGVCPNEDFSMNFMESLAAGKPIISINPNRKSKKLEIGKSEVLIPEGNSKNIIEAVNYLTEDKAKEMRKECEKKSKMFSIDSHIKKILEELKLNENDECKVR